MADGLPCREKIMAGDDDIKDGQDALKDDFEGALGFDLIAREREQAQRREQALESDKDWLGEDGGGPRSKFVNPALVDIENTLEPSIDETTPLIHMGTARANAPSGDAPVRTAPDILAPQAAAPEDIDTPPTATESAEPTNILIDNLAVDERSDGAVIGGLTVIGERLSDNRTYRVDDDRFEVVADQLKLRPGIGLDHDVEPDVPIRVEVTDANDTTYAQNFTISVNDINVAPVDINLDKLSVAKSTPGAVVGQLSTFDPDLGDTHVYAVSDDRFEIVAGTLKVQDDVVLADDTEPTIDIDITATDPGGRAYTETFVLEVTDPVWPDDTSNELSSTGPSYSDISDPFTGDPPENEVMSSTGSDLQLGAVDDALNDQGFMSPALVEDMPYAVSDLSGDMPDIEPAPDGDLGWTIVFDDGSSLTGTGLDYMDMSNDLAGTIYFDDGSELQFTGIEDLQ